MAADPHAAPPAGAPKKEEKKEKKTIPQVMGVILVLGLLGIFFLYFLGGELRAANGAVAEVFEGGKEILVTTGNGFMGLGFGMTVLNAGLFLFLFKLVVPIGGTLLIGVVIRLMVKKFKESQGAPAHHP